MKRVLVTGGTGTLGRVVVRRLLAAGHEVRVVSRRARPAGEARAYTSMRFDLRQAEGVDSVFAGVDTVIHCASTRRGGDVEAAQNVIAASRRADVSHLVYISIVGVDRVPLGYYHIKLAVERMIANSRLPWTTLRTTQFHDLVLDLWLRQARLPFLLVPSGVSIQPIDVREVAARLLELAAREPAGRVPDVGGPWVRSARDLARAYLRATGQHRLLLPLRLPGAVFAAYRRGGHLAPTRAVGRITFEDFLAERINVASRSAAGPDSSR